MPDKSQAALFAPASKLSVEAEESAALSNAFKPSSAIKRNQNHD